MKQFHLFKLVAALVISTLINPAQAQTTISTPVPSFSLVSTTTAEGAVIFGVRNTNATAITLTGVASYLENNVSGTFGLWYTTTVLGAPLEINSTNWTQIATATVSASPAGIKQVFTGLNFTIPANTTYRLALSGAINSPTYGAANSQGVNMVSAGGVELYIQDNPNSPGYGGAFPGPPGNTPRGFFGSITFQPTNICSNTITAGSATTSRPVVCIGGSAAVSSAILNLTGTTTGTGQTYQWQTATTAGGPFTDIGTSSGNTDYLITPTTTAWYRAAITCGGNTVYSAPVSVSAIQPLNAANTYTIDNTLPTDGNNFKSFTDAIAALSCGVTGQVVFNVTAGQVFTENVPVINYSGTAANNITFRKSGMGANPRIIPASPGIVTSSTTVSGHGDGIIVINGGDYITFDGIDLATNPSFAGDGMYEYGYYLKKQSGTNACKNVTIKNCNITLNKAAIHSFGIFVSNIQGTGSVTVSSTGGRSENIKLSGNTITNSYGGINVTGFNAASPYDFFDHNIEIGEAGAGGANTITGYGGGATIAYGIYTIYQNNLTIKNNTVVSATGTTNIVYGIFNSTAINANADISYNTITVHGGGTTQTIYGINNTGGGTGTSNQIDIHHNTVTNSTYPTATTGDIQAIVNGASAYKAYIYENTVSNNTLTCTTSGIFYGIFQSGAVVNESRVYNNQVINNTKSTGTTGAVYGINHSPATTSTGYVYGNVVSGLNGTGTTGTVFAIAQTAGGTTNLYQNRVYNITSTSTGASSAYGISVTGGTTNNVYNNFVSDIKAPTTNSTAEAIRGISVNYTTANTSVNLYYNTVYLNATSSGTNFSTAGIYHTISATATSANLTMQNNNIVNVSVAKGSGRTIAYRRSTSTVANYNTASNNNNFFAGTPGTANLLFYDGTNSSQNLAAFRSTVGGGRESSSVSELPPFENTTTAPFDLHLKAGFLTLLEKGGITVDGITDDFDGDVRNSLRPDIGADEFNGNTTVPEITLNSITPSTNPSCVAASRSVSIDATAAGSTITGVTISYNNGTPVNNVGMINTTGNTWTFTIPAANPGNALVTWSITATNALAQSYTYIGASYQDEPLTGITANITASVNPICNGSSTTLRGVFGTSGTVTIGTDNATRLSTTGVPYRTGAGLNTEQRNQYLILASELQAANMVPGDITALRFIVTTASPTGVMSNLTFKMANTNVSALTSTYLTPSFTTVLTLATYTPVSGDNNHTFTTPFTWDGVSNVLIEVCGKVTTTGSGVTIATFTTTNSSVANSSSTGCTDATGTLLGTQRPVFGLTGMIGPVFSTYSWSDGTNSVGTTNPLIVNPTVNTNYTVTGTDANGCSITSAPITVTVAPLPTAPTATNSTQCGVGVPTLSVTSTTGETSPDLKWYDAATGGTMVQDGGEVYVSSVSNTTSFWVSEKIGNCESPRTQVTVTVTQPDAVTAKINNTVTPAAICPGTAVVLTVEKAAGTANYSYTWSASPDAGSGMPAPETGATVNITPTDPGTYVYTVTGTDGPCTVISTVTLTVSPVPVVNTPTATATTVCEGASTTLTATTTVTAPVATIGSDNATRLTTTGVPYRTGGGVGNDIKTQYLILASELTAAGLSAGNITSITFTTTAATGSMNNLTFRMGHTAATAMTTTYLTPSFTTVRVQGAYSPVVGANVHGFTTPFVWDGTSNVVLEVCGEVGTSGGCTMATYTSPTPATVASNTTCAVATGSLVTTSRRPVITFNQVGVSSAGSLNWVWNPGSLSGNSVTVTPGNVGVNSYTVRGTNATGCYAEATIDISVTAIPSAPTATNSTQCGVGVPAASVTSTTGVASPEMKWYSAATGGTLLQDGGLVFQGSVSNTTSFWVAEKTGDCESPRTQVTVTVTAPPALTITPASTICNTAIQMLEVTSPLTNYDTYVWTPETGLYTDASATIAYTAASNASQVYVKANTGVHSYTLTASETSSGCMNQVATTVTVQPDLTGISATPDQEFCVSGTATLTAVPATGFAAGTLQWQSSPDGIAAYTDIVGANNASYNTSTLSQTGYYRVILKNSLGATCASVLKTVAVNNPQITGTTPASRCGNGTVILGATGSSGVTLNWYTTANGGIPVATGNSFTTPVLSATTPYYVTASQGLTQATLGLPDRVGSTTNTGYTDIGLMFDAAVAFNLNSVSIYPVGSGGNASITIELRNSSGTVLQTTTATVPTSASPGTKTLVPLNFNVPAGTGHRLVVNGATGLTGLIRESTSGFTYPYTYPGIASITSAYTSGASNSFYYYFYDWKISVGCESPRVAVTATVNPGPAVTVTANKTICNNAVHMLEVTSNLSDFDSYIWSPSSGLFVDDAATIPYTGASASQVYVKVNTAGTRTYTLTATDATTACGNVTTTEVIVMPNATIIASPEDICVSGTTTLSASPATGYGTGTFQWQSSPNGTAPYTDISGANTSSYTTPTLTADAYYALVIKDAPGGSTCATVLKTVVVNNPQVISKIDGTRCGDGSVMLSATSNAGSTLSWYTTAMGGSPTATGNIFNTPVISSNTTYYVAASAGGGSENVGRIAPNVSTSLSTATRGVFFNATTAFTLNSVVVYPFVAGSGTIEVRNSGGTVIAGPVSVSWPAGTSGTTPHTLNLNMNIPAGTDMFLVMSTMTGNLTYEIAANFNGAYPYTSPSGTVSITASRATSATPSTTTYYYFYDWNVSTGCQSPRTAVTATINPRASVAAGAVGASECGTATIAGATEINFTDCDLIGTITPSGATPISGSVDACVKIESAVMASSTGERYVPRHYNITPTSNATTATSTVTLYFLQNEFDAFNADRNGYLPLPANASDPATANVKVTQFNHGGVGTGLGTYPAGSGVLITPTSVAYDAAAGRWSVTFDATGSGAFYVHTGNFTLPVTITNFKGEVSGSVNKLVWTTSTETNNRGFELERSSDGVNFSTVTFVATKADRGFSTTSLSYNFDDVKPLAGSNYYRLKQIDNDGKYSYSNVILLTRKISEITMTRVYPNPTMRDLNLVIASPRSERITIVVTDLTGKMLMQQPANVVTGENLQQLNVAALAAGTYVVKAVCANGCETAVHRFVKQ